MATFDQWLSRLDPNQAPITLLVFTIVIALILFFSRNWWPWFIKDYWPSRRDLAKARLEAELAAEKERNASQREMGTAVTRIAVMLDKMDDRFEIHDTWLRNWAREWSPGFRLDLTKPLIPAQQETLASSALKNGPKGGEA